MTRPAGSYGEVRQALLTATQQLYAERGPVTRPEIVQRAQVGDALGRMTLNRMADAGEIKRVGRDKPAGAERWMTLYEPAMEGADDRPRPWGGIEDLLVIVDNWVRPP